MSSSQILLHLRAWVPLFEGKTIEYPGWVEQIHGFAFIRACEPLQICKKQPDTASPEPEAGWRYIDDPDVPTWYHSKWAANFARYLQMLKWLETIRDWEYQPRRFRIKYLREWYTPDFLVIQQDGERMWVDLNDADEKNVLFELEYPKERLRYPDLNWFEENLAAIKRYIPEWEK